MPAAQRQPRTRLMPAIQRHARYRLTCSMTPALLRCVPIVTGSGHETVLVGLRRRRPEHRQPIAMSSGVLCLVSSF